MTPGLSFYRLPDFVRLDRLSFSVYAFHLLVFLTPAPALQNYRMQYGIMHMQELFEINYTLKAAVGNKNRTAPQMPQL